MNIGILGIGGVGGYFGGLLADRYRDTSPVRIIFIARGATADVLNREGLRLIMPAGEKIIRPAAVAKDGAGAGPLDVLICATKSYDLDAALIPLKESIGPGTMILPLLNGVNAKDIIAAVYPEATILSGCVYVNAKQLAAGVIEKTGPVEKLYFGSSSVPQDRLEPLLQIFTGAGIAAVLSENIETDTWTKFVLTAGMANATSYFNESIGRVMAHPGHREVLVALVSEAYAVAVAKGILLPSDTVSQTLAKLAALPYDATSSMHRDFRAGGRTEYRSLAKYLADLGDTLGVDTPTFDSVIPALEANETPSPKDLL